LILVRNKLPDASQVPPLISHGTIIPHPVRARLDSNQEEKRSSFNASEPAIATADVLLVSGSTAGIFE